jgi:hypothetical protein
MLLWIWLLGGLGLAAVGVGLIFAMGHAERRARRMLFRALGLDEATVELLMARNGDVMAELALVRRQDTSPAEPSEPASAHPKASIRLVHPISDEALSTPPPPDPGRPAGERRRLRLPGRS